MTLGLTTFTVLGRFGFGLGFDFDFDSGTAAGAEELLVG